MTDPHVGTERLNDLADGLLAPDERAAVEAHLAACAGCAAEADALGSLRRSAAALPRAVDPGVDLRPGIRTLRKSRTTRRRAPLAAAALLVLAAGGAVAIALLRGPGAAGPAPTAAAPDDAAEVVLALDRAYQAAGEELKATVAGAGLQPEAARLVAAEVAAVERALAESRAALREDPGSPILRELVLAAHRQRLDVLRRAAELAAEMEVAS